MQFCLFFASFFSSSFRCFCFYSNSMIAVPANSTYHCHQCRSLCGKSTKYTSHAPIIIQFTFTHRWKRMQCKMCCTRTLTKKTEHGFFLFVDFGCDCVGPNAQCASFHYSIKPQVPNKICPFLPIRTEIKMRATTKQMYNDKMLQKNNRQKNNKILRVYRNCCSDGQTPCSYYVQWQCDDRNVTEFSCNTLADTRCVHMKQIPHQI